VITYKESDDVFVVCYYCFLFLCVGAPSKGYLEQAITSSDNPFLRSNVQAIKSRQMKKKETGKNPKCHSC